MITREEALRIAKGLKHNHSNFYYDMNKIIEYINQQPQLSEDVEEFFKFKYDFGVWSGVEKMKQDACNVKEVLQAQASEIERLKQENQDLKIDKYQQKNLIKKYHNNDFPLLHKEIEEQDEKLDAIREVVKKAQDLDRYERDLYIGTKTREILGDSK